MTVKLDISFDADVIDAFTELAQKAPRFVSTFINEFVKPDVEKRTLTKLRRQPPPASRAYPLPWTSEKQRKFVMAMLRSSKNLPYRRTGTLVKSWRVVFTFNATSGALAVYNDAPQARFVQGDDMQVMFKKIGWLNAGDVLADDAVETQDDLINAWYAIATDPTE